MTQYKLWNPIESKLQNATCKVNNILNHTGICPVPIKSSEDNRIDGWKR